MTSGTIRIGAGSLVCQEANLSGDVTIGKNCVIHPKCMILAEAGPIVIGDDNIVEEQAIILNSFDVSQSPERQVSKVMHIGSKNCFEVGSRILYY
jgi:dynactin-6